MNPTLTANTEAAIWERVIHPEGELTPQAARALLQLEFSPADLRRMRLLATKAQAGKLTAADGAAIDNYERVGTMLSILKSKARKVLKKANARRL